MRQNLLQKGVVALATAFALQSGAGVLQDTNLKVGSNHSLLLNENWWALPTYNSISAGYQNTNNGHMVSIIGSGQYNMLIHNTDLTVRPDAQSSATTKTIYTHSSLIGGGQNNIAVGFNEVIAGGLRNHIYATNKIPANTTNLWWSQVGVDHSVISGGADNWIHSPLSAISGGWTNRIGEWANFSVISGGHANRIDYGSGYSTISGGGRNQITRGAWWAAINGGEGNKIYGQLLNTNIIAEQGAGFEFNHWGWIGGGLNNVITNTGASIYEGRAASIGGGWENMVSGELSTISGGYKNGAIGQFATVPGGSWNHADGISSFAAGRHAHANHSGSFVWADYNPVLDTQYSGAYRDVISPNTNTFSVRASGGFWFGAGLNNPSIPAGRLINTSSGGYLTSAGVWTSVSDRNAKERFKKIDPKTVLEKVASLPIQEWKYKVEDETVRHIGPVAQDFYAAFSLGNDDRAIGSVDADGVALAAIQGLNQIVTEKDEKIRDLEERLQKLEALLLK
jgi:hypothetical protein